jgi:hypothetical protein
MRLAYRSYPSLTALCFALAFAACSSGTNKNSVDAQPGDSTVPDTRGTPILTISPTSLNFPELCPGPPTPPQTIQVMNEGDSAASVDVKVSASGAGSFTAIPTGCDLIAPGASCTIAVVFTRTAEGQASGKLELTDSRGLSHGIALESFSTSGPAPFWISSSSPSDLGSVAVGTTGPAVTFTVNVSGRSASCSGPDPLVPFTVTLSSAEFVITDDTCSTSITPIGGTCTISVAFRPTSAGTKLTDLVVAMPSYRRTARLGASASIIDAGLLEAIDSGLEQEEAGSIATDGGAD